jgi:methyl-accepting chemotaxis protein
VEDGKIVFEREFEAGEEYTTVYGLRAKDTDDIERFLTEPRIEGVEGEETVSDIIGDTDEAEEEETESAEEEEEEAPSIDLNEPAEPGPVDEEETVEPAPAQASADDLESAIAGVEEPGEAEATEPEADEEEAEEETGVAVEVTEAGDGAAAVETEDLASALAAEIRAGDVDDEDLETLRDALGADLDSESVAVEAEIPGHVEAKLDKLQSDVDEVVAYTDALAEFLDDAGTADDLLALREEFEDLQGIVTGLEDRVESVAGTADDAADRASEVADHAERVDERVDDLSGTVEDIDEHVTNLEDDLGEELDSRVTDLETELDDMEEDIETLENLRQALAGGD